MTIKELHELNVLLRKYKEEHCKSVQYGLFGGVTNFIETKDIDSIMRVQYLVVNTQNDLVNEKHFGGK